MDRRADHPVTPFGAGSMGRWTSCAILRAVVLAASLCGATRRVRADAGPLPEPPGVGVLAPPEQRSDNPATTDDEADAPLEALPPTDHGSPSSAAVAFETWNEPPRASLPPYPVRYVDRPLTLPSWWVFASASLGVTPGRICVRPVPGGLECAHRGTTHLIMVGQYGFTRWLTVESRVAARLFPDVTPDPFSVRFRLRLLDRAGHRLVVDVTYGQSIDRASALVRRFEAGPYGVVRFSPKARMRGGVGLGFTGTDTRRAWALGVPLALDLAPHSRVFLTFESRFALIGPRHALATSWEIPIGAQIGGVLASAGGLPAIELFGSAQVAARGPSASVDRWSNDWNVQIGFRWLRAQRPPSWRTGTMLR